MKTICILFKKVPDGTHFTRGAYSYVRESLARVYIAEGYGEEYNPKNGRIVTKSPYSDALEIMSKKSKRGKKTVSKRRTSGAD